MKDFVSNVRHHRTLVSALILMAIFGLGLVQVSSRAQGHFETKALESARRVLTNATEMVVYSLEPDYVTNSLGTFHKRKILGETAIKETDVRKSLGKKLEAGIFDKGVLPNCIFVPRHGVRASFDKHTFDFVICFHCGVAQIFEENQPIAELMLSTSALPKEFNEVLKKANIPLAK